MNRITILVLCLLLPSFCCAQGSRSQPRRLIGKGMARPGSAQPTGGQAAPGQAPSYQKANKVKLDAYVVLLRLRYDLFGKWKETGKWPDDKEANQALAVHGKYWQDQLKQGRVLLTGGMKGDYWDNVAIIILEAESEQAAKEIVANDPAVKAFVFQAQVRPFDVHAISNKYNVTP